MDILEELTYRSYRFNRLRSPDIAPERWKLVFANVEEMERRFRKEQVDAETVSR